MGETDQPLSAEDIVQSAQSLSVVSAFVTGETTSMFEIAQQMPEYKELILAYGRYSIDALRDRGLAGFISNKQLADDGGVYTICIIFLSEEDNHFQTKLTISRPEYGSRSEAADKMASFQQHIKERYAPVGIDADEVKWSFDEIYTSGRGYDNLKNLMGTRDFQPEDFITNPKLLKPFVLSIKNSMTAAAHAILQDETKPIEDLSQRALDLVDAFRRANEILTPVFQAPTNTS